MKVVVAKSAGFCWGVKRAVNIATRVRGAEKGSVYCLGELIHNKREIERLKALGIEFVHDVSRLEPSSTVIIRSHGVPPSTMRFLRESGFKVVDATCPFVKDVHKKVVRLEEEGYPILILGNPNHPEVVGIAGHVAKPTLASSIDQVRLLPRFQRLGVVCQTTLNTDFFREALSILSLKSKELKVFNTICSATARRQKEAKELAKVADVMLIVGGRNSSNTSKLYQISKRVNERSYHVESAEELEPAWFAEEDVVGITAGASTPEWVIDEIVRRVTLLSKGGTVSGGGVLQTAGRKLQAP